jgi:hypothetical protein
MMADGATYTFTVAAPVEDAPMLQRGTRESRVEDGELAFAVL